MILVKQTGGNTKVGVDLDNDGNFEVVAVFGQNGGGVVKIDPDDDPETHNTIKIKVSVCFMEGTHIRTPDGECPVESLRVGDRVLTADGKALPLRWLGRQTVSRSFADPQRSLPVLVRAGAFGEGLPVRDLLVSPSHALYVHGVLAQAGALVNGVSIVRHADVPEVFRYFNIELDEHALILAEGIAAESFVDNVSREHFDNWEERLALGCCEPIAEMPLPRAKSSRQVPVAVQRFLAERAAQLVGASIVAKAA